MNMPWLDQTEQSLEPAGERALTIPTEYLVSYGNAGAFGRFRPKTHLIFRRGDPVVVETHRGLEIGMVLCDARAGHAIHLPNTSVGRLVRPASPDDQEARRTLRFREAEILADSRHLVDEQLLPVEIMDVEVLLDGQHAALLYLETQTWDPRSLVSTLSREHKVHIFLESLSRQNKELSEDELLDSEHGCGRPNCGKSEGGGCSTCGSGGGCSTCGSTSEKELKEYFGELRQKMDKRTALI
jgi:cell fate regulator YaaT (PSP1 superfamily)